ncbi:hypothetical protein H4S14_000751 [Agrobacterium vitis]|nr:hypothetical protein [Agrobacterium vitis]MBE1437024.1 hypothetical protein [Agrobacterium vitis]
MFRLTAIDMPQTVASWTYEGIVRNCICLF